MHLQGQRDANAPKPGKLPRGVARTGNAQERLKGNSDGY
jgi:hypothetical protein